MECQVRRRGNRLVGFVTMCISILWERVKQLKVFVRIWWRYCLQLWLRNHNPRKYSLTLLHKNACTKLINQWTLCSYMKTPCAVQMLWRKAWTPPTCNACESTKCKNCVGRRLWKWIPNLNWKCFNTCYLSLMIHPWLDLTCVKP
jgi:hypothetical protein